MDYFYTFSGITQGNHHDFIKGIVKKNAMISFFLEIMNPVCNRDNNMFLVQIGRGDKAVLRIVKVFLAHIGGDGEFLDWLIGTSHRCILRNCRICMDAATSRLVLRPDKIVYRDDVEHSRLVKAGEQLERKRIAAKINGRQYKASVHEENTETELANYSMRSGENPLYPLFSELNERGILSLHKAVNPDRLHVIYKGIIEKTIAWTLSIVSNLSYFMKDRKFSMQLLDSRVMGFPCMQAWDFCR